MKRKSDMTKVDYYNFSIHSPYKLNGESYPTLRIAKSAYRKHLAKGDELGCCIYGKTIEHDDISLTFTPWFGDTQSFGRTKMTTLGKQMIQKH